MIFCLLPWIHYAYGRAMHFADEPDSVYLFSYATGKNNNHNGLHFAWSRDRETWHVIGNEYGYLRSDYGRWGSEKRMISPFLFRSAEGLWHCVWSLNERENVFAHASSADLVDWGRQSYQYVKEGSNFLHPVVTFDKSRSLYRINYVDKDNKHFAITTTDFKKFTGAEEASPPENLGLVKTIPLPGGKATGQLHRVPWVQVDKLIKTYELRRYKSGLYGEVTLQDSARFSSLKDVKVAVAVEPGKARPISNLLMGIFFEDINYAADGGLYAELIQNRDFEYSPEDKSGRDSTWNHKHSWTLKGDNTTFRIDSASPLHKNNPHYAVLSTSSVGGRLVNSGFNGIPVKKGHKYNLALFAKRVEGKQSQLAVSLVDGAGKVLADSRFNISSPEWKKMEIVLTADNDADSASLHLTPLAIGETALDMISLFPQSTFNNRKNGLRKDLAQAISDIRPRFMRFPGGCVAHGDGLANIYQWKNTIGPLEVRKPQRNLWGYHQTVGLGYLEYFQFCEDIGAEPLPVIAAGVPCQNSGTGGGGQQGGVPMEEMDEYIQDILDLVEWANGDANTKWGKLRAAAGHPKPFNLKYIGIGNEDLITDIFEERFTMIYDALKKKHPEITVIGTVGPYSEGTDYEEGWELAAKLKLPMVDEHYYQQPGWFIYNQDYYDRYDRAKSKVYLGEYAAHLPGRPNNLETSLAEALYLTSLERNGDIVSMASYAPLLAKEKFTQWNPNLIYFNNNEVKTTVGYEVQKLFGLHSGTEYLPASITVSNTQDAVRNRVAISIVRDSASNDVIIKMVNLLPVPVQASIDLKNIVSPGSKADRFLLQGNPADLKLKPVKSEIPVDEIFNLELQRYSFNVVRIKR